MMLDQKILKRIKQVNVSKNLEKTKERVRAAWMPLSKAKREEVSALSDLTKFTVQRTYKKGTITAKLAIALAKAVNVTPYYFTGEADVQLPCSDELLFKFLIDNGYKNLLEDMQINENSFLMGQASDISLMTDSSLGAAENVEVSSKDTEATLDAAEQNRLSSKLLRMAQECIKLLSEEEQIHLDAMPDEDLAALIDGLSRRGNYNDDAKCLSTFIKIILTA